MTPDDENKVARAALASQPCEVDGAQLKTALDSLEKIAFSWPAPNDQTPRVLMWIHDVRTTIYASVALASQQAGKGEPVAEVVRNAEPPYSGVRWLRTPLAVGTKLYASPPSREPLTDEQIRAEWLAAGGGIHGPNVETVNMPESRYFKFRRDIHSREGGSK